MISKVAKRLSELGPCLSGTLTNDLEAEFGLSRAAAKKRVERAKTAREIIALDNFRFKSNEQFVYLAKHVGTSGLRKALSEALREARSPLRYSLMGMRARGGLVPESLFETFSGLPFQGSGKLKSQDAKARLIDWEMIERVEAAGTQCLRLNEDLFGLAPTQERMIARMLTEQAMLEAITDWFRLQALITAEKSSLRGQGSIPQFGWHAFDLVAPSYAQALVVHEKGRQPLPGFVVADVCLGRELTLEEVQYFINKCTSIRVHTKNRPFIAFLIANWFDNEAFLLGRKKGLSFTTPQNLFGKQFSSALDEMSRLLESHRHELRSNAQTISVLMEKMEQFSHLHGLIGNLKGTIFEMIVGHCISGSASGKVTYGRKFKDPYDEKEYDSDVLLLEPDRRVVGVECKGKNDAGRVKVGEVDHWFCKVVPLIYKQLKDDRWFKGAEFEFSFWTSTEFEDDALAKLNRLSACTKYKISWKNGREVANQIDSIPDTNLKTQYRNWFESR